MNPRLVFSWPTPEMRRTSQVLHLVLLLLALAMRDARADDDVVDAPSIEVVGEVEAKVFEDTVGEIQIVPRERIEQLPGTDASEILSNLPGVSTRGRIQGEEQTVSIEGLQPEFTRILVDGNRYAGEINEADDVRDLCLENLERVEVRRGTQAIRFGPEAAGGAINFVTRRAPRDGWRVSAHAAGGGDGAHVSSGTVAFGKGRFGTTLSHCFDAIDGFSSDGIELQDGTRRAVRSSAGGKDNRRTAHDFYGTTRLRISDSLDLTTNYGYRRERGDFVADVGGVPGLNDQQQEDSDRYLASGRLDWDVSESTTVAAELDYYYDQKVTDVARPFVLSEDEWSARLAADTFFETEIPGWASKGERDPIAHVLYAAAEFETPRLDLDEDDGNPFVSPLDSMITLTGLDQKRHFATGGIVVELESDLTPWLSTAIGLRTFHHSRFHNDLLPQIAVRLRPHRAISVRASYGRNVRAPTLKDLYQPPSPQLGGSYFLAGNEALEPERTQSYRLGLEWETARWLSFAATGFYNEIDDAIRSLSDGQGVFLGNQVVDIGQVPAALCRVRPSLCPSPLSGGGMAPPVAQTVVAVSRELFRRTNLDRVRTWGLEAYLRFRPHRILDLQAGYTLTESEIDAPNLEIGELINSPRHVLDLSATLVEPASETTLTLTARYRGKAFTENVGTGIQTFATGRRSDPSWQLDTRLTLPLPIFRNAKLYGEIRNLTNERIVDSFVVRGRTFFFGARIEFDRKLGAPLWSAPEFAGVAGGEG